MTHVKNNSGNNEWYTPSTFIESARLVMGSIDLDPASYEIANKIVKASVYYDSEIDGLSKEWHGNVWLNPPYSKDLMGKFIDKLCESDLTSYITITNNATETKWGRKLLDNSDVVCFVTKRVKFITPEGMTLKSPLQGQMICYKGVNDEAFIKEFSKYGVCCMVVDNV